MRTKAWFPKTGILFVIVMLMLWELSIPCVYGCPLDGSRCRGCIAKQLKSGCPGCTPIMQCMARCLWGGTSRSKCIKKCDCDGGYPRLADCKKCLTQCKCSCSVSS